MITAIIIMIFTSLFLTVLALFFAIRTARQSPAAQLKRRLRRMAASSETIPSEAFTSELLRKSTPSIYLLPLMGRVKKRIEHSGVHISPFSFVFLSGMTAALCFIVVFVLSGNTLAALLAMLVFGCIPFVYLGYRKQQRQTLFDEQLPDALTMIARSLRAGHSLLGAIELISQEMPEPTGGLFKIAYDQQRLGMGITDSLQTLLEKVDSMDLNFFVTIIRINYETGGNLAEILDKLADTVRSRLQVRLQVKVYSAQGRMSGYILSALPVAVFVAFYFLNPGYINVFFTEPICQFALLGALLAQFAGFLIIRKIVDIRI
ncbi:MAG TPA: type II secretion system F family protein [Geobacteraceae bacterium]|nr:type II secretion system F family protein [Geobacteraceae bacterium]